MNNLPQVFSVHSLDSGSYVNSHFTYTFIKRILELLIKPASNIFLDEFDNMFIEIATISFYHVIDIETNSKSNIYQLIQ